MNGSENGRSAQGAQVDSHTSMFLKVGKILAPVVYEFERKVGEANRNGLFVPPLIGEEPVLLPYDPYMRTGSFLPLLSRQKSDFPFFKCSYWSEPPQPSTRIQVPIGEYGTTWSFAIAQTTRAIYSLLELHMPAESMITDKQHGEILTQETFRKQTLKILIEAAQSTAAATALLTPEKVEGFEDNPLALFHELRAQDVLNQYGRHAPNAIVFPMVIAGVYFSHPIESQVQENGARRVRLSESFVRFLKDERKVSMLKEGQKPGYRQHGCPGARKNVVGVDFEGNTRHYKESAIHVMAEVFEDYLGYFYHHPFPSYS